MWTTIRPTDSSEIVTIGNFQRATDPRYKAFTNKYLEKWVSNPNVSLLFADEGTHRLAISIIYDADKDRYYISEMGMDGNISLQNAFKVIATEVISFFQNKNVTVFYASRPIDSTLPMNNLYAEVLNDPRFHVEILIDDPKFQKLKINILPTP